VERSKISIVVFVTPLSIFKLLNGHTLRKTDIKKNGFEVCRFIVGE